MSQGQVIDIMTFNSYSLQYYSFRKGKIGTFRPPESLLIKGLTTENEDE